MKFLYIKGCGTNFDNLSGLVLLEVEQRDQAYVAVDNRFFYNDGNPLRPDQKKEATEHILNMSSDTVIVGWNIVGYELYLLNPELPKLLDNICDLFYLGLFKTGYMISIYTINAMNYGQQIIPLMNLARVRDTVKTIPTTLNQADTVLYFLEDYINILRQIIETWLQYDKLGICVQQTTQRDMIQIQLLSFLDEINLSTCTFNAIKAIPSHLLDRSLQKVFRNTYATQNTETI